MRHEAEQGKIFKAKNYDGEGGYLGSVLYLGRGDSIDNYIQVDIAERDEWERQQEQKEKEAELHRLLRELYPDDKEE